MKSKSGKTIRWISMIVTVVALISMAFGVSVMADTSVVVGDNCYDGDIDGDGKITTDDAIYLLYHSVFGEDAYPLTDYEYEGKISVRNALELLTQVGKEGTKIHAYNEPTWQWTDNGAKAVFTCACKDKSFVETAKMECSVEEPTCIKPGSLTFTATVELTDDHVYTAKKTAQGAKATGVHTYDSDVVCKERTCTTCKHVEEASAHTYKVVSRTAATCTEAPTNTYQCKTCGEAAYTEVTGAAAGHTYGVAKEKHVDACEYKEVYTCSVCMKEVDGECYSKHVETAEVKKEATCSHEGEKLYTCSKCNNKRTEKINVVADAHTWNTGEENIDGTIKYICKENRAHTRTAINASKKDKAEVGSETLKETKEIDIKGTSLSLDDKTAEQLGNLNATLEIKAEEKTADDLKLKTALTDEQKEQIGNNPVYDFSITCGDKAVTSFEGKITISLPYTLQEGDDADCIDVWFIKDDGTVTIQEGKYANGFVTFTTNHFSYYTVTRLTPEQRCKKYGHNEATKIVAASCTEEGYTLHVCARCGEKWKTDVTEAPGHDLTTTVTAPTCTKNGKKVIACSKCDYKETSIAAATGHAWETADESQATCKEAKKVTVGCTHEGCTSTKEVVLAQLKHTTETTSVPATCVDKPYNKTVCTNDGCDYELIEYTGAAAGHSYEITKWNWNKEEHTATATFTCSSCENTFDREATVTIEKVSPVTCTEDGYTDYLAKVVYNRETYTDSYKAVIPKTGHQYKEGLQYDALQHYYECTICDAKVDPIDHTINETTTKEATCTEAGKKHFACEECDYERTEVIEAKGHSFTAEGVVTTEPTCTETGLLTYTCTVEGCSGTKTEEIPAKGHVFDSNKICTVCGYDANECEHNIVYSYEVAEGDTCSDGYIVHETCTKCDFNKSYEEKTEEGKHFTYQQMIDVSKYDLCEKEIEVWVCPCGEEQRVMNIYWNHDWKTESWKEEETENGYETSGVDVCEDCSLTKEFVSEYTYTGNACNYVVDYACEYKVDGKVVVSEHYTYDGVRHNNELIGTRLLGEDCEDGVEFTYECSRCDAVNTETKYCHEQYAKESYNAAEYGMCAGKIELITCACGEYNWIAEDTACDWEHVGYDNTTKTDRYKCSKCGIINDIYTIVKKTEGCTVYETEVYEYIQDGTVEQVVLSLEREDIKEKHDYTYTFEIEEGATCRDGYTVNAVCKTCEKTDSWSDFAHESDHDVYRVETYDMSKYGFCDGYLYVMKCPCGEENYLGWWDMSCDFEWYAYDEETETTITKCTKCGGLRHSTEVETGEVDGCYVEKAVRSVFYNAAGAEQFAVNTVETFGIHNFEITFEIEEGATCSDGYTIIRTCKECDEVFTEKERVPEGTHRTYRVDTIDMKEYGFCGGTITKYQCACGAEKYNPWDIHEYCDFEWVEDKTTGEEVYGCTKCGGYYIFDYGYETIDTCHEKWYEVSTFCSPDGEELFVIEGTSTDEYHDDICTFEVTNGNCENGYKVTKTCQTCGSVRTDYGYEHETYAVEKIDLAQDGICGGTITKYQCACGEEVDEGVSYRCYFSNGVYDDTTDTWTYTCNTCGSMRKVSSAVSEKDDDCMVKWTEHITLCKPDGTAVVEYDNIYSYPEHNIVCTFDVQGTSCEDGYYMTLSCKDCDYKWTTPSLMYGHNAQRTEVVDLEALGLCGGELYHYECACGEYDSWSHYGDSCSWEMGTMNSATCSKCGVTQTRVWTEEKIDACNTKHTTNYTYTKDGEVVFTYDSTYSSIHHDAVYTLELMNPDGDCYGGYRATGVCQVCDEIVSHTGSGHGTYPIAYENLSDDGLCDGTAVRKYSCACGYSSHVGDEQMEKGCHWNYQGATSFSYSWECAAATDSAYTYDFSVATANAYRCYACNAVKYVAEDSHEKDEFCRMPISTAYVYQNASGQQVYQFATARMATSHYYELKNVDMNDEKDCEAGYNRTYTCNDCGDSYQAYGNFHYNSLIDTIDLTKYGVCTGSYVNISGCFCGENAYISCSFPGCATTTTYNPNADGTGMVQITRCNKCKLMYKYETVTKVDKANCKATVTDTYTIMVGDTVVLEPFTTTRLLDHHDLKTTATLVEGATSCNDGVRIKEECKNCDYKQEYTTYGHRKVEQERYDLSQYGSKCGGYVVVDGCACGEDKDWYYNNLECELDYQYISSKEEYPNQMTPYGENSYWRYEGIYKCAVTDPECGFAIYVTTYHEWDEENCEMIGYKSWKLGSNDDGTKFDKEIIVETSRNTYHDYETETSDNGNTVKTTCKKCESYTLTSNRYDENGRLVYSESTVVNNLDNGYRKRESLVKEYKIYKDYSYIVKDYQDYTYASGDSWWYHYDYEYDWDNFDCTRIQKYTDAYGNTSETEQTIHNGGWTITTIEPSTCTQYGKQRWIHKCRVCEQTITDDTVDTTPRGHGWIWDDSKGLYECGYCELESTVGADGSVIFEDMSEKYGNGTEYVIGYYQKTNVQFSYELWAVVGETEVPVEFTEFKELTRDANGINAISFNKAAAEEAAKEALKDVEYTDFDLRFVFYPEANDGDLDYAITLTE